MAGDGETDIDIELGDMEGDLDPSIMSFQASAIIAVCAAVLIGNGFLCALNCFKLRSQGGYLKLLLVSAVLNMLAALVTMPLMAAALIEGEWKYGYALCKLTGSVCFMCVALTMLTCAMASLGKMSLFLRVAPMSTIEAILHKDFVITFIVFCFVAVSLVILTLIMYSSNFAVDPYKVLCTYANSPNITGYRMFYLAYSALLTLGALVLAVPFDADDKPAQVARTPQANEQRRSYR